MYKAIQYGGTGSVMGAVVGLAWAAYDNLKHSHLNRFDTDIVPEFANYDPKDEEMINICLALQVYRQRADTEYRLFLEAVEKLLRLEFTLRSGTPCLPEQEDLSKAACYIAEARHYLLKMKSVVILPPTPEDDDGGTTTTTTTTIIPNEAMKKNYRDGMHIQQYMDYIDEPFKRYLKNIRILTTAAASQPPQE